MYSAAFQQLCLDSPSLACTVPLFTCCAPLHRALLHRASLVQCCCSTSVPCFTEPRFNGVAVHLLRHALPSLVSPSLACTVPLFNNCALLHRASPLQCHCSPAALRFTEPCFTEPRLYSAAVHQLCIASRASLVQCCCSTTVPCFTESRLHSAAVHLLRHASEPCFTEPRLYSVAVQQLCIVSPSLACTVPLLNKCSLLHRASLVWCRCSPAAPRFTESCFHRASLVQCRCSTTVPCFTEPRWYGAAVQ